MAVIALPPKVYFDKVDKVQLLKAGLTMRSRYTGKRQVIQFPFAVWVFDGKLIPMEGADAGKWRSFLLKLDGQKNTFKLPVPGAGTPLSGLASNAGLPTLTLAARATAFSTTVAPSTTLLKEGDYFNIGDELKVATADAISNGAGAVTVNFMPMTRAAHSGSTWTIVNPYIHLAMVDNDAASWSLERPVKHGIKMLCMEAF